MAKKQPYIPIYMGDDVREFGHLSPEVYGCYCRLRFAMWDREDRGRIPYDLKAFMRLMGTDSLNQTKQIVANLIQERVLEREPETGQPKYLVRRQMLEDFELSKLRSKNGSKGGKTTQQKAKQNNYTATDFAKAKSEAKRQQNTENEIEVDNEDEIENRIGGMGERMPLLPMSLRDCAELYRHSSYEMIRATLCRNLNDMAPGVLLEWLDVFVDVCESGGDTKKTMEDFTRHFRNWTLQKLRDNELINPKKYFSNGANNGKTGTAAKGGGGTYATAVIDREGGF